jgi:hypothetical protein
MALNTRSLNPKQLVPGLAAVYGLEYKQREEIWRKIFEIGKSEKAYEEEVTQAGFGLASVKTEGGGIAFDKAREVYTSRYFHDTVAMGFEITEEAQEDNLYGSLLQRYTKALARSMRETKEVKGHSVLNRGFDAAFKGGDGQPLFSTVHPLSNGSTFSNFLDGSQLAESSLEQAINLIGDFVDERGLFISARATQIAVPTELQFVIARILNSPYRTGTGDNDINVINKMSLIPKGACVSPYLTDPSGWFLGTDVTDGLKHYVRMPVKMKTLPESDSGNIRVRARERYSFSWSDPRTCVAGRV